MQLGPELVRLAAAWPAEQRATAATNPLAVAVGVSTTTAPAPARVPSALSLQLDEWLKMRPHLFHHLLIAEQKRLDAEAATAAAASAAANDDAATTSADIQSPSTGSTPAAKPVRKQASSDAGASDGAARPAPPAWLVALEKSGASSRVVNTPLLWGLLRRAFRLKLRSSKDSSARLSNAFALTKRLVERTADLRLLPLVPLRTRAYVKQGPVRVSLRCLGAFKRAHHSTWFQLQWRVDNVSEDRNVVLTQRKIVTVQREAVGAAAAHAAAGSMVAGSSVQRHPVGIGIGAGAGNIYAVPGALPPDSPAATIAASATAAAAAAQAASSPSSTSHSYAQGTSRTSLSSSSSFSSAASSSSSSSVSAAPANAPPFVGLRVESMGIGLAGRPIALPSGSSTGPQRGLLRLDGSCGTVAAELHFNDVSSKPHRSFVVQLPQVLLDAANEWNEEEDEGEHEEDEEEDEDDDSAVKKRPDPRSPQAQHATRAMLAGAAQLGTAEQLRNAQTSKAPQGDSSPSTAPTTGV
jgi:hypothetical protein